MINLPPGKTKALPGRFDDVMTAMSAGLAVPSLTLQHRTLRRKALGGLRQRHLVPPLLRPIIITEHSFLCV